MEPEEKDNRQNYPSVAQSFGITGIVFLGMLIFLPVYILLYKSISREAAMFIYYLFAIGVPFWIVFVIRKRKTTVNSFNLTIENKRIVSWVIVGTIALIFGFDLPIISLIPMPESWEKLFTQIGNQTGFFAFLLIVITGPIFEELIFRGIILDGLLKKYTPLKSILISSLLFGLIHLNPWQFVSGFIMGLFSGWVYSETRSLLPSILIHSLVNFISFLMRALVDIKVTERDSLINFYGGPIGFTLSICGSITILFLCIYCLKKEFIKVSIKGKSV